MTSTRHPRALLALIAAATGLALAGCSIAAPGTGSGPHGSDATEQSATEAEFLAANGLAGLSASEIIDRLDQLAIAERPSDLIASVQPDALVLTDTAGAELRLDMPADRVYVSVAPFQTQTHECYFHSLTTCTGELANAEVDVSLVAEDGTILAKGARQTYDNGFIGFWMPRGIEATLTVAAGEREGSARLSTMNPDDPTCITTLQLT